MARKKTKYVTVPDYKEGGDWVKTKTTTFSDHYLYEVTEGYVLWNSVNKRCDTEAEKRKGRTWYLESENHFEGFGAFVSWCHDQQGYGNKDALGNKWQLDKDLLVLGNKVYSPDTCIFVPSKINSLLLSSKSIRGEYPIGVCFNKRFGKFVSQVNDEGKRKSLGYFTCPMKAHKAWQEFKVSKILEESENSAYGEKLRSALKVKAAQIEQAIFENKETIVGVNV